MVERMRKYSGKVKRMAKYNNEDLIRFQKYAEKNHGKAEGSHSLFKRTQPHSVAGSHTS